MAAAGNGSAGAGLRTALEQLCSSRTLRLKPERPVCAAVIGLDRYLADERSSDSYSYDVTLTDGTWRVKCLLSSELHHLVQKNTLRCGCRVSVTHLSFVYDERRLGQSYVCLEELECEDEDAGILSSVKDLRALQWWMRDGIGSSVIWHVDAPLQSGRKHYLSLWNNEDPHGGVWIPNSPPADVVIDVSKICLLGDLDAFIASSRRPLPLLVRVLHRSRLRYYGKPGQNIDYPFQAYFEVADQSGVMSMVLWNDLCPEWYHRLVVGSVLYLQNYSLKKSYQNRSRPQISSLPLIKICLNPRNPSAIVTVIPPKSVQPQWSLPDVSYNFCTRSEIENLASNQACDIIGLVTFVGRVERIRNKGNTIPEKFWTYRWVHAVDGTSHSPFILEIFASSQPDIFNNICPMTYLVCTQMRVCREAGCAVYLTSSAETQLFITGCHKKQPYVSDPKVKAFIQWTKTLKDSVILRKTAVGGHYCYPPPSPTFTPYNNTAVADLQVEMENLQYRECKRVTIQGHITAVHYHRWPPEVLQSSGVNGTQRNRQVTFTGSCNYLKVDSFFLFYSFFLDSSEATSAPDTEPAVAHSSASWESSDWAILKHSVANRIRCCSLNPESVSEKFCFDDRDSLLQRINLSPSRWSPDLPLNTQLNTLTPVDCAGYFTLTVLGKRQWQENLVQIPLITATSQQTLGI
uniref:RPA1 related single stranded DNA binding protein n=1 Tax=Astyanax mexicanus TaxID=7994 RepID=A0A8B9HGB9_ASTMX